jgi:thiosulfate dehydrogenase
MAAFLCRERRQPAAGTRWTDGVSRATLIAGASDSLTDEHRVNEAERQPRRRRALSSTTLAALLAAVAVACTRGEAKRLPADTARTRAESVAAAALATRAARASFRVPNESEIKDTVVLAAVRRGRAILANTRDSLPGNVGNRLRCVSCHMGDGLVPNKMPLVGVYARFPQYRPRSATVEIIEDRINDCFERSMNGKALARDSRPMRDVVAYLAFLSYGIPVGSPVEGQGLPRLDPLPGDSARGRELFAARCTTCHGTDGQGGKVAPGAVVGPPLWGPHSYNIGAGMARVRTAASFIHVAMPFDNPGSLTAQQAYDLATFINTRPRPDFASKADDWPNGDPPPDVAYPTRAVGRKTAKR